MNKSNDGYVQNSEVFVALPKGRLLESSKAVLWRFGIVPDEKLVYSIKRGNVQLTFHLLKMQDIPRLVSSGMFTFGIAPDEWILETAAEVDRLVKLGWYHARVCLLRPMNVNCTDISEFSKINNIRVVTEFPHLAQNYFRKFNCTPQIIQVHGSCEAFPPLMADFAIDIVETGATAQRHGLMIADEIVECDVHLIAKSITSLMSSIQGVSSEIQLICSEASVAY